MRVRKQHSGPASGPATHHREPLGRVRRLGRRAGKGLCFVPFGALSSPPFPVRGSGCLPASPRFPAHERTQRTSPLHLDTRRESLPVAGVGAARSSSRASDLLAGLCHPDPSHILLHPRASVSECAFGRSSDGGEEERVIGMEEWQRSGGCTSSASHHRLLAARELCGARPLRRQEDSLRPPGRGRPAIHARANLPGHCGAPGDRAYLWVLALLAATQLDPDPGARPVVVGGLDQRPPGVARTGLGDRAMGQRSSGVRSLGVMPR